MKHPLVPVALCYAAGIVFSDNIPLPLPLLAIAALAVLVCALAIESGRIGWTWFLAFLAGAVAMAVASRPLSPVDLRHLLPAGQPVIATVEGTLTEAPSVRVFVQDEEEIFRSVAVMSVTALSLQDGEQPAAGDIVLATRGNLEGRFLAGQRVRITGVLQPPPGPRAPGLFDYHEHLRRQGIHFQLKSEGEADWKLAPGNSVTVPSWSERFIRWAKLALAHGQPDDESLRLQWAMTLGWKAALTDEISEPFMRSGTLHIFAISGLHIALIAGILVQLAKVVRVPRHRCWLVVVPVIWGYTVATGLQASAIRSTIMMTVIIGGWALKRPPNLLNSLFTSALIILGWQPRQLFQASFQLSFLVVLSIALLLPPVEKWCQRWFDPDPLLPRDLRPAWRRSLDLPARWLVTSVATSVAAWLGSMPLTAYYFHLLTPGSLFANLLVVPASSLALASSVASLLTYAWAPWLTELFNNAGWSLMNLMVRLSQWFAAVRGFAWHVPAPTLLEIAFYVAAVFPLLNGWLKDARRRWLPLVGAAALVLSLGLRWHGESRSTRLTVLPLHGGQVVHIDAPGRSADLLVDCGSTNSYEFLLRPYLKAAGVNSLARLALTHGDIRHVGAAPELAWQFPVARIFTSALRFRSPFYRKFQSELSTRPGGGNTVNDGDEVAGWQVLHPRASDKFTQADDGALVLRRTIGTTRFLLLSDLGREGQRLLLDRHTNLLADVVVIGLPAKGEPLNSDLLAAIQPKLIIVADADSPASERAPKALLERLGAGGTLVISTRRRGAAVFECVEGECSLTTMDGLKLRLPDRSPPTDRSSR